MCAFCFTTSYKQHDDNDHDDDDDDDNDHDALLQREAPLLKSLPGIKVIALAIGRYSDRAEVEFIASSPQDVFLVPSFFDLRSIEEQLLNDTRSFCSGKYASFV